MAADGSLVSRPHVTFSEELAEEICDAIATSRLGLERLCDEHDNWPHPRTINKWLFSYPEFSRAYELAKEQQGERFAYEIIEIGDNSSGDVKVITNNAGKEIAVMDREYVARDVLRCENRRWMAARLAPRRFGDKLALNATLAAQRAEDFLDQLD